MLTISIPGVVLVCRCLFFVLPLLVAIVIVISILIMFILLLNTTKFNNPDSPSVLLIDEYLSRPNDHLITVPVLSSLVMVMSLHGDLFLLLFLIAVVLLVLLPLPLPFLCLLLFLVLVGVSTHVRYHHHRIVTTNTAIGIITTATM